MTAAGEAEVFRARYLPLSLFFTTYLALSSLGSKLGLSAKISVTVLTLKLLVQVSLYT